MMEKYEASFVRIGRAEPDGQVLVNGHWKKKHKYMEYFKLRTGELVETHKWTDLAMAAVEQDGKTELYERIRERTDQFKWLQSEKERKQYALECMYSKAYEHWSDFTIIWA